MPFATWDLDTAFATFRDEAIYRLAQAQSPLLAGMGQISTSHSTASSVVSGEDGTELDLPSAPVQFSMTLDVQAVRRADLEQLPIGFDAAAEELGRSLIGLFVDTIGKVTDFTGNTIKSNGLTFEAFYEALDQIEWSLDEDDELIKPTLAAHPETVKNMPTLTPEQEQMLRALEERKHQELLARRRHRRLS